VKRDIFVKVLITLAGLMFIIPLWLIGFHSIKLAIEQGHFPMYEVAIFLDCPEWLPLVISIILVSIMYYLIIWRGMIKPYLLPVDKEDEQGAVK